MALSWRERLAVGAIGSFTLAIAFMALAYAGLAIAAGGYVRAVAALAVAALGMHYARDMLLGRTP